MSPEWKNRMHQLAWWQNDAFDETEIRSGVLKLSTDDSVMACGIPTNTVIQKIIYPY